MKGTAASSTMLLGRMPLAQPLNIAAEDSSKASAERGRGCPPRAPSPDHRNTAPALP
jgi:hypothetical protein